MSSVSALKSTVASRAANGCFGGGGNPRAEIQPQMQTCPLPPGFAVPQAHCWLWTSPGGRGSFCRLVSEIFRQSVGRSWVSLAGAGLSLSGVKHSPADLALVPLPFPQALSPSPPPYFLALPALVLGRLVGLLGRDKSTLWAAAPVLFLLPAVFLT